jgi:hypothetical protein
LARKTSTAVFASDRRARPCSSHVQTSPQHMKNSPGENIVYIPITTETYGVVRDTAPARPRIASWLRNADKPQDGWWDQLHRQAVSIPIPILNPRRCMVNENRHKRDTQRDTEGCTFVWMVRWPIPSAMNIASLLMPRLKSPADWNWDVELYGDRRDYRGKELIINTSEITIQELSVRNWTAGSRAAKIKRNMNGWCAETPGR